MPTATYEYATETERLSIEQAIAYVQELTRLALTAAPGTVLDVCEQFALDRGRRSLCASLEAALLARTDATDHPKKKSPTSAPKAAANAGS